MSLQYAFFKDKIGFFRLSKIFSPIIDANIDFKMF